MAELSRNRWELLRASFTYCSKPLFPCYRTISRHWNNQPLISALLPNQEFYNMLEDGSRILLSQLEDTQYGISVSNRFKWILYLTNKRLHDTIHYFKRWNPVQPNAPVTIYVDFLFWYDGGKIYGQRKGLFAAIKLANVEVRIGELLCQLSKAELRFLISRSWTLILNQNGETTLNTAKLETILITQFKAYQEDTRPC